MSISPPSKTAKDDCCLLCDQWKNDPNCVNVMNKSFVSCRLCPNSFHHSCVNTIFNPSKNIDCFSCADLLIPSHSISCDTKRLPRLLFKWLDKHPYTKQSDNRCLYYSQMHYKGVRFRIGDDIAIYAIPDEVMTDSNSDSDLDDNQKHKHKHTHTHHGNSNHNSNTRRQTTASSSSSSSSSMGAENVGKIEAMYQDMGSAPELRVCWYWKEKELIDYHLQTMPHKNHASIQKRIPHLVGRQTRMFAELPKKEQRKLRSHHLYYDPKNKDNISCDSIMAKVRIVPTFDDIYGHKTRYNHNTNRQSASASASGHGNGNGNTNTNTTMPLYWCSDVFESEHCTFAAFDNALVIEKMQSEFMKHVRIEKNQKTRFSKLKKKSKFFQSPMDERLLQPTQTRNRNVHHKKRRTNFNIDFDDDDDDDDEDEDEDKDEEEENANANEYTNNNECAPGIQFQQKQKKKLKTKKSKIKKHKSNQSNGKLQAKPQNHNNDIGMKMKDEPKPERKQPRKQKTMLKKRKRQKTQKNAMEIDGENESQTTMIMDTTADDDEKQSQTTNNNKQQQKQKQRPKQKQKSKVYNKEEKEKCYVIQKQKSTAITAEELKQLLQTVFFLSEDAKESVILRFKASLRREK